MTKDERTKHNREAIQILGWIFGWWKDKKSIYKVPIGFEIHHRDGDVTNNSLDNLQILTVEEHLKIHEETRRETLVKYSKINGKKIGKKLSKKVLCVETGIIYESMHEAGRQTGANYRNISSVCNGKYGFKTAGGYHWRYVDE